MSELSINSTLFGGFSKRDVVAYVESLSARLRAEEDGRRRAEQELSALGAELAETQKANATATKAVTELYARLQALSAELADTKTVRTELKDNLFEAEEHIEYLQATLPAAALSVLNELTALRAQIDKEDFLLRSAVYGSTQTGSGRASEYWPQKLAESFDNVFALQTQLVERLDYLISIVSADGGTLSAPRAAEAVVPVPPAAQAVFVQPEDVRQNVSRETLPASAPNQFVSRETITPQSLPADAGAIELVEASTVIPATAMGTAAPGGLAGLLEEFGFAPNGGVSQQTAPQTPAAPQVPLITRWSNDENPVGFAASAETAPQYAAPPITPQPAQNADTGVVTPRPIIADDAQARAVRRPRSLACAIDSEYIRKTEPREGARGE
ncbi:MAG: hypothetical protein LBQ91_02265 [Oscillospiraceae bacterium]|jgi:hypothetical protein|nr:hypothetical protein [Oscillospiraceae bacterium]